MKQRGLGIIVAVISVVSAVLFIVSWTFSSTLPRAQLTPADIHNRRLRQTINTSINETISHHNRSLILGIHLERTVYKIPSILDANLINWNDRPSTPFHHTSNKEHELPIFWHILKSGGTTMKLMYATCYNLVEACETGGWIEAIKEGEEKLAKLQEEEGRLEQQLLLEQQQQEHHYQQLAKNENDIHQEEIQKSQEILFAYMVQQQNSQSEVLQTIDDDAQHRFLQEQWQLWQSSQEPQQQPQEAKNQQPKMPLQIVDSGDGRLYVNVDITTPSGIQNAADRGFASSNLADVLFTPLLVEATSKLLSKQNDNKGRLFAVFRHPVDRVTSLFYYLQKATWESTYNPIYATWTIEDYVNSPTAESNWMVRSLVNKLEGPLDPDDVKIAKEILNQKCLIGLMDRMEESVLRFHKYFGFDNDAALNCALDQYTSKAKGSRTEEQNSHSHPLLDPKGETYKLLAKKNRLDIVLYEYAVRLFDEQGVWMKKNKLI